MAITFPSISGDSRGNLGASSLTFTKPTGTVQGDLLVCFVIISNTAVAITPPGDWTTEADIAGAKVYSRVAGASEPASYSFARGTNTNNCMGIMVRCSGVDSADPIDVVGTPQTVGSSTSVAIPGVTVTDGVKLLQMMCVIANTTMTPPGGTTEHFDQTFATQTWTGAAGSETVGAGATGTRTWTAGTGGTRSGVMLALRAAAETIAPSGIASTAALGTPTLIVSVNPSGIASTAAVGTPTLNQDVNPTGIASTSAVGTPTLNQQLTPSGIASTVAFGTPQLDQQIVASGIAPTGMFGTPEIFTTTPISPTGIAPTSAVGTPRLDQQITGTGIAPTSAVGTPTISIPINPTGIASTSAVGTPALVFNITPTGIGSTVAFGTARLDQQLVLAGIGSQLTVGVPSLVADAEPPDNPHLTIAAYTATATITHSEAKAVLK